MPDSSKRHDSSGPDKSDAAAADKRRDIPNSNEKGAAKGHPEDRIAGDAADSQPAAGTIEYEFGVPFAGVILPQEQWAKTALKSLPSSGPLDFVELFGRDAPRVLDIGCGNGRFLIASAVRRPDVDHIGIDSLPMVIRYATRRANMRGLTNCRLAVCDGQRFLSRMCAADSLDEIHAYHPQPFADRAAHGSRLFDHEFLWLLGKSLRGGGRLYVQTDNLAYWNYLQQVLPSICNWQIQEGVWPEDPQGRSRREIVALNKGLTVYRGWGTRLDSLEAAAFQARCQDLPQPAFSASHDRNPRKWRRSTGQRKPPGRRPKG